MMQKVITDPGVQMQASCTGTSKQNLSQQDIVRGVHPKYRSPGKSRNQIPQADSQTFGGRTRGKNQATSTFAQRIDQDKDRLLPGGRGGETFHLVDTDQFQSLKALEDVGRVLRHQLCERKIRTSSQFIAGPVAKCLQEMRLSGSCRTVEEDLPLRRYVSVGHLLQQGQEQGSGLPEKTLKVVRIGKPHIKN